MIAKAGHCCSCGALLRRQDQGVTLDAAPSSSGYRRLQCPDCLRKDVPAPPAWVEPDAALVWRFAWVKCRVCAKFFGLKLRRTELIGARACPGCEKAKA